MSVHQHTQDVRGCLWLSVSTHKTSVCVCQHTQDVRGCRSAPTGRSCVSVSIHRTSVPVRVCPSAHTGRLWLSISTHISPLVLGLCTLALPVDCLSDFGPRGLSVQYTQDVRGCPPAHTGRPWRSVCVRQHTQDVRGCPSVYISARWSLDSARWPFPWTVWVILAHVGCLFSTHRLSVQYTQDVCWCPTHMRSVAVHQYTYQHVGPLTPHADPSCGLFGTSVAVHVCPSVSVSRHRTSVAVPQYTYQHVGPWTQHAGPSRGLFGTSVAVCGCPSAHTGRPWVSVCVCQHTQDVCGCPSAHTGRPCVSVSIHRTSVAVRVCPSAHTGRSLLSISTHISTLVLGLRTLALPVDCLGDFGPRGLSAQYTQDVRGCPPAHTGRPWLSLSGRVCPSAHTGRPWLSISTHIKHGWTSVRLPQHPQDVVGLSQAHTGTFVAAISNTYPALGPLTRTIDPLLTVRWLWPLGCILVTRPSRVSARQRTGSSGFISDTYQHCWSFGLCTLALPVDCLVICGPSGYLSVHTSPSVGVASHTKEGPWFVCGCPSSTHRPSAVWLLCCVWSVSTHRPFVAVHQYTYQNTWSCATLHAGHSRRDCLVDFGPPWGYLLQYTTGCPWVSQPTPHDVLVAVCVSVSTHRTPTWAVCSVNTGRPWVSASTHRTSVAVRVCPSSHTGHPWLSLSTHIRTLVLGLSTLALPVDCSGDLGPRGLSVQYTQDVCGCPSAHSGRPCVSVSTHRTSRDVRVYPCVSVSTHRTSVAVHLYTYQHVGPWTQHAYPSRGLFG
ncbi:hypothetical protein IGI04_036040 [Brassica rapa subsp. trilocularis]|uniref:Uncharacterized protein n=1 Tax=Brassica rapa subsp. trilocularis TaxID=1813537 RepID=A0ABQ7LDC2_BRACM|nr:hypothetical protein IGI04_036040 [Brassica rapa subsp. trilocularis]